MLSINLKPQKADLGGKRKVVNYQAQALGKEAIATTD